MVIFWDFTNRKCTSKSENPSFFSFSLFFLGIFLFFLLYFHNHGNWALVVLNVLQRCSQCTTRHICRGSVYSMDYYDDNYGDYVTSNNVCHTVICFPSTSQSPTDSCRTQRIPGDSWGFLRIPQDYTIISVILSWRRKILWCPQESSGLGQSLAEFLLNYIFIRQRSCDLVWPYSQHLEFLSIDRLNQLKLRFIKKIYINWCYYIVF